MPGAADSARDALAYGAVALFVARAMAADRRFALTDANVEGVSAICRQLDGMPLAIEFAAARVRELGVAVLRDSLAQRFRMLTTKSRNVPARQRSFVPRSSGATAPRRRRAYAFPPARCIRQRLHATARGCNGE